FFIAPKNRGNLKGMSFRLWTILYVFTLLALGIYIFGWLGIIPFFCALFFWACAFSPDKSVHAIGCLFILAVGVVLSSLFLPSVGSRPSWPQGACINNIRNIALELRRDASKHGALPPATINDEHGNPLLSWRTEILPSIE